MERTRDLLGRMPDAGTVARPRKGGVKVTHPRFVPGRGTACKPVAATPRPDRVDSRRMVWEIVFMLILLKIPLVYLCMVVWWAIRAEPRDEQPTVGVRVTDTPDTDAPVLRRPSAPRGGRPAGGRRGSRMRPRTPSRPHASRAEVRS